MNHFYAGTIFGLTSLTSVPLTSDTFATLKWGTNSPGRRTIEASVRIAFVFTDCTISLSLLSRPLDR